MPLNNVIKPNQNLYNYFQTNDYRYIEIITWNHIIVCIRLEYLKLYKCVQIICIR